MNQKRPLCIILHWLMLMAVSATGSQTAISDCWYISGYWWAVVVEGILTTFGSDAEAMLEALVGVGAGDDFGAGTAYIHIPLVMHNVTSITLQPVSCKAENRSLFASELGRILKNKNKSSQLYFEMCNNILLHHHFLNDFTRCSFRWSRDAVIVTETEFSPEVLSHSAMCADPCCWYTWV